MAKGKYEKWLKPENLNIIEGWAREGLTNAQIAKNIGINQDTLYAWLKKYPEFSESLKKGKITVDYEVENALLKRALGYDYDEVKTIKGKDDQIKETIVTRKHMPPNVVAQIYWLKNRKPELWRDKVEFAEEDDDQVKAFLQALRGD